MSYNQDDTEQDRDDSIDMQDEQGREDIVDMLEWISESAYPWEVDLREGDGVEKVDLHHVGPEMKDENEADGETDCADSAVQEWFGEPKTEYGPTHLSNHATIELNRISSICSVPGPFRRYVYITCCGDELAPYEFTVSLDKAGGVRTSLTLSDE